MDEQAIHAIRADFPPLAHTVWMQQGGVGLVPRCVQEYHLSQLAEWHEQGPPPIMQPERAAEKVRLPRAAGVMRAIMTSRAIASPSP